MPGVFKLAHLHSFNPLLISKYFNFFTFILGGQFLLPQRANIGKLYESEYFQCQGPSDWTISSPLHLSPFRATFGPLPEVHTQAWCTAFLSDLSATLFLVAFPRLLPVPQVLPSNRRGVTSQKTSLGDSFSRRNSLCTVELKKFQKIVPRIREMASCEVLVSQRDFQATCTCHSTTS